MKKILLPISIALIMCLLSGCSKSVQSNINSINNSLNQITSSENLKEISTEEIAKRMKSYVSDEINNGMSIRWETKDISKYSYWVVKPKSDFQIDNLTFEASIFGNNNDKELTFALYITIPDITEENPFSFSIIKNGESLITVNSTNISEDYYSCVVLSITLYNSDDNSKLLDPNVFNEGTFKLNIEGNKNYTVQLNETQINDFKNMLTVLNEANKYY